MKQKTKIYIFTVLFIIISSIVGIPLWNVSEKKIKIFKISYVKNVNKNIIDVDFSNIEMIIRTKNGVVLIQRQRIFGNFCIEYTTRL